MTCMTSLALPFQKELVVDLFAGGGGASSGIAEAYREPDAHRKPIQQRRDGQRAA